MFAYGTQNIEVQYSAGFPPLTITNEVDTINAQTITLQQSPWVSRWRSSFLSVSRAVDGSSKLASRWRILRLEWSVRFQCGRQREPSCRDV